MKRLTLCCVFLFVLAVTAFAETEGHKGHEAMKGEGHQMMCPKMQQMHGQGMMQGEMMCHGMMQDMMQMMSDLLNTQEKIVAGVKKSEKKQLLQTIKDMKEKMEGMTSMSKRKCMMGGPMEQKTPATSEGSETGEKEKPGPHVH